MQEPHQGGGHVTSTAGPELLREQRSTQERLDGLCIFRGSGFGMDSGNTSGEAGAPVPRERPSPRSLPGQQGGAGKEEIKGLDPAHALQPGLAAPHWPVSQTPRLATATASAVGEPTGWHQSRPLQTRSIPQKAHRSLVLSEASQRGLPEVTELAPPLGPSQGSVYHCAPTSTTRQLSFGNSHGLSGDQGSAHKAMASPGGHVQLAQGSGRPQGRFVEVWVDPR